MPRVQVNCPNCKQPVVADVQQLFDVNQNPQAKQELISGAFNIVQCQNCGYKGNSPTPIVYHDLEKKLLLTFFPPELGKSRDEQEQIIGSIINKVVKNLPQEQRKGYLFQPQAMLSHKVLVERILEADGITKEMIDAQEKRMDLIRRLMTVSEDGCPEIIQQEDELIDEGFFVLFSRLIEQVGMGEDQDAVKRMTVLQGLLLEHSTYGRSVKVEMQELQKARQTLEELGEELTREKLLNVIMASPNEARLHAYAQLARPGMDYQFFQMMSERIEHTNENERPRLLKMRDSLVEYTREIDKAIENRTELARHNLDALLEADDIEAAVAQNIGAIDEIFIHVLTETLAAARQDGDVERSGKLQSALTAVEAQMAPPPEYELIDNLLELADDEKAVRKMLQTQADEVVSKLIEIITGILGQIQASVEQANGEIKEQQQEMLDRLQTIYNLALRISMERKIKQ